MNDAATEAAAAKQPTVTQLQSEVDQALVKLAADTSLVHDLARGHQGGLGFLTPESRKILDAQLQADRLYRRTQPDHLDEHGQVVIGLDWLNRDSHVAGTGYVRSSATISAVHVEAEILFTNHDLIRRTIRRLRDAGVCTLHRLDVDPTTVQVVEHLRTLIWSAPSPSLLQEIQRETDHLTELASLTIDGNDRAGMEDPCPHCNRQTLVAYFRDGLIRCDRDPHTSNYAPCQCEDRYCDCKSKPVSFRHTWYRSKRTAEKPVTAHDWHDLANRLNIHRAATKETCPS